MRNVLRGCQYPLRNTLTGLLIIFWEMFSNLKNVYITRLSNTLWGMFWKGCPYLWKHFWERYWCILRNVLKGLAILLEKCFYRAANILGEIFRKIYQNNFRKIFQKDFQHLCRSFSKRSLIPLDKCFKTELNILRPSAIMHWIKFELLPVLTGLPLATFIRNCALQNHDKG